MKQENNGIIEKYNNLNIDKNNPNCRIRSLAVMLNINGVEISESELMLLAMSHWIRAGYIKNYHKLNLMLPFAFSDNIEEMVFNSLNIEYRDIGAEIRDYEDVIKYIEQSIPLLIVFDCNKLSGRQNERNINIGVLSTGVVLAYEKGDLIFNSLGGNRAEFRASFKQIDNSRHTDLMPVPAKGEIFIIDNIQNIKNIDKVIWQQIYETSNLFLNINKEVKLFDKKHGIYQYDSCWSYDVLIVYIENLTKQMFFMEELMANKIFSLVCSVLRKGISSGSGSLSRLEYGAALKKFAKKKQCKDLEYAAELIVKSGKYWRDIARKLYSVKVCYPKSIKFLEDICYELKCIKEIEVNSMKKVKETILKDV